MLHRELSCPSFAAYDFDKQESTCRHANLLLLATLRVRPDLAARVQTFQTCTRALRYGSLTMLVECVALCPNLVHVDVTLGCVIDYWPRERPGRLKADGLKRMARLKRVRHLVVRSVAHGEMQCELLQPALHAIHQLVVIWPSVQILCLDIAEMTSLRWAEQEPFQWPQKALPNLRDVRCADVACERIVAPLLPHAPNLNHVLLMRPDKAISDLPRSLPALSCHEQP